MARPQRVTDEQIEAAARAVFLAQGAGAPVTAIASRLGMSHPALLQRVGSKELLLRRVMGPSVVFPAAALSAPPPQRGAAERLVELLSELRAFLEGMLPNLTVLRAAGRTAPTPREPPTLLYRRLLARWLERTGAFERQRCAALAEALLGAVEARCFNAYLGGEAFVSGDHDTFLRGLVSGVTPELARASPGGRHEDRSVGRDRSHRTTRGRAGPRRRS